MLLLAVAVIESAALAYGTAVQRNVDPGVEAVCLVLVPLLALIGPPRPRTARSAKIGR